MEIVGFKGEKILVSECDYEHLSKFKWSINNDGYTVGNMKNTKLIHRYIFIEILGRKELTRHNLIDHINGNKLDNTRVNLRIVTAAENARNKNKTKNASSKYFGVRKSKKLYQVSIKLNDKTNLYASYENEEHAAYQYDLWIEQYKITNIKKNNIDKPDNFIEYVKKERKLPKNIYKNKNNNFQVYYKNISNHGEFKTLEEAEKRLKKVKDEIKNKKDETIKNKPIKRNEKGESIIELYNKKKEKVGETIIDEEIYYDLIKYSWCYSNGYVHGIINKKTTKLYRYIINYNGKDVVDHINGNKLDNRKSNLRIVTQAKNMMNKSSHKNATSKYIGVNWDKNTKSWLVRISINGKSKNLGRFKDEIEAAKVRDIATKEHYKEFGKLNFPDEIKHFGVFQTNQ
jgi:hypothetical protein